MTAGKSPSVVILRQMEVLFPVVARSFPLPFGASDSLWQTPNASNNVPRKTKGSKKYQLKILPPFTKDSFRSSPPFLDNPCVTFQPSNICC